jgi:cytochrome c
MRRALLCCVLAAMLIACSRNDTHSMAAPVGDPDKGKILIRQFDCGACHVIPGIRTARGRVGPSLDHYSDRAYVAGKLPNGPEHLVDWIRNPTTHSPRTAMPDLNVSEAQARDIAAYLYSLK